MKEFPAIDRSVTAIHPSSGLADNRSPVAITKSHITVKETDAKDIASDLSSSEDEGPEEPAPLSSLTQKVGARSVTKHKSRQGSVHNLVDLWEGGASNTKGKQHEPPSTSQTNYQTKVSIHATAQASISSTQVIALYVFKS